ncbi:hypothetical protein HKT18_00185 [Flavobacterium sp. IMCC34852]|uniref:Uncharacterized protein n=1 Tax=Flavobacterium rivulicola TaxID=2732161 RepID=A0A7Y3VXR7_9FLAO|nr:hypothetical protein [Flavobacterium sp. IMCC34852]NNT70621.1 hypothetical protein [Flavobacterium sp. IMCC34852]
MKQKAITFLVGFLVYGTLFGVMMYYTEAERDFKKALTSAAFFGIFMALFEVYISPKIKKYFVKK